MTDPAGGGPVVPAGATWSPPDTGTPLRLLLVRHGETGLTAGRRYSGRGDVPLSERGVAQAAAVARRVAALGGSGTLDGSAEFGGSVVAVYTSPLVRCVATAETVARAVRVPVTVEPDLVECDFGAWEGLGFAEVRERYPAELAAWLGSQAVAPPGGESFHAVGERVRRCLARLRSRHAAGTVVVVSHVSPIKLMLRDALAATDAFLHRCFLSPAGLSIVDEYADGGVAVRAVNETAHLG